MNKVIGSRRSKFQIIADILKNSKKPSLKTQIMYESSLSFQQLKQYLSFLKFKALLRKKEKAGKVTYQITEKGLNFLKSYNKITRLLQP